MDHGSVAGTHYRLYISQKFSAVNIGLAFQELGFEHREVRHVRGYVVVRCKTDEMQQRRGLAATLE